MTTSVDSHSIMKRIRVAKEDSAFVYFILESYEGICSYSTLPFAPGEMHRDLELNIPIDFIEEVQAVLALLGGMVHELT